MRALVVALTILSLFSARDARAHGTRFLGGHPIAAKYGGGYCYIDAPHVHAYPPDHAALYQRVGDDYVFTADPTPFGYDGDRHPFYGHHPVVTVSGEPVFCYLDGPHYHPFEAPSAPDYKIEKGVAFYVGAPPPAYVKLKAARRRAVNAEYRPYVAMRPTIEVAPPTGWSGEVWVAPPAVEVEAPGVYVGAPGVAVIGPRAVVSAPSVAVRAPGVVVSAPGVVFAPPRVVVSAPGVVVGAPGVYVGAPGVVVGGRGHRGHGRDHDDGRDRDDGDRGERGEHGEHGHHGGGHH